jgi:transposase IS116/IS110/IS902 family protein
VSSGNRKIHRLSLRGNRRVNHAIHMAAITQIRHRHSEGRAYYEKKLAEGKRTKRRSGPSSARSATPSSPASRPTPARPQRPGPRAREGTRGTTLHPARPAHTPHASSSDKPLPDLAPAYDPAPLQAHRRSRSRRKPRQPLDTNSKEDSLCTETPSSIWLVGGAPNRIFCCSLFLANSRRSLAAWNCIAWSRAL